MRRTRLVATLAVPRAGRSRPQDAPEYVARMVAAGMDVARLNLSHCRAATEFRAERPPLYDAEEALLDRVRAASESEDVGGPERHVGVLLDLQGIKVRLHLPAAVRDGGLDVEAGATLRMRITREAGPEDLACDGPKSLVAGVREALARGPSLEVAIGDGDPILRCVGLEGDVALLESPESGRLLHRKGVTFRGVDIPDEVNPTHRDLVDLAAFALPALLEGRADFLALSFTRSAEDVRGLRALCRATTAWFRDGAPPSDPGDAELLARVGRLRPDLAARYRAADGAVRIVAKIETASALRALDGILREADAVMVARGDLGLQCGPELVPPQQKNIIRRARMLGRSATVATQMLASMEHAPEPTRAEASDIFNAVLDGADALLLSGETAAGDRPETALRTLGRIVGAAESWQQRQGGRRRNARRVALEEIGEEREETLGATVDLWQRMWSEVTDRITRDAVAAAEDLAARAIVAATRSGETARLVARFDPSADLIAIVPSAGVARGLALTGAVRAIVAPAPSAEAALERGLRRAVEIGLLRERDRIVVVSARPGDPPGVSTSMDVREV